MEKTLRELCEEVVAVECDVSRPKWELKRAWDKLHDATDEASQILDALDAERAAVLEEVRSWLKEEEERAWLEGRADMGTRGRFTRRFLAGKEGA